MRMALIDSVNLDTLSLECAWLEGRLSLLCIVADSMGQPVLAGIKVRVLTLLFFFDFVKEIKFLFIGEFFAINPLVFVLNCLYLLLVFLGFILLHG
jgi:hypothetical protein